ncbi:hypothetical protein COO91_00380 [Nostoc flagelliforme CCNUN1]|uniref:Uncharacterized protein n=1 Tax=Nostoc flagelliforme CCNUN1 TaxID=2038116 RepID=A0A2K8SI81_9NOSO|nr:hypothetical protein [Nostoc flagelliforme]AUB34555.1 hypothetical protein COO91_00380 [Nostoc flagelliforme CCNUN1]
MQYLTVLQAIAYPAQFAKSVHNSLYIAVAMINKRLTVKSSVR